MNEQTAINIETERQQENKEAYSEESEHRLEIIEVEHQNIKALSIDIEPQKQESKTFGAIKDRLFLITMVLTCVVTIEGIAIGYAWITYFTWLYKIEFGFDLLIVPLVIVLYWLSLVFLHIALGGLYDKIYILKARSIHLLFSALNCTIMIIFLCYELYNENLKNSWIKIN